MMHVYFLRDYEQYKKGRGYGIEVSLGRKLWSAGVVIPWTEHLKEKAEKIAAKAEAKKKRLLKAKAKAKREAAKPKKVAEREKSNITYNFKRKVRLTNG